VENAEHFCEVFCCNIADNKASHGYEKNLYVVCPLYLEEQLDSGDVPSLPSNLRANSTEGCRCSSWNRWMVAGAKEVGCMLCAVRTGLLHLLNDAGFSYYTRISLA